MGELFHKIEQLDKCGAVDLHRDMLTVEYDTVFIIVYVWRVLEAPFAVVDDDGDDPVVFSGRMIEPVSYTHLPALFRDPQERQHL